GGLNYSASSAVTTADEAVLRQVPLPQDAEGTGYFYPPDLLARYTQMPGDLQSAQQVQALKDAWTSGQTTMYGMAQALEEHLRAGEYKYRRKSRPGRSDGGPRRFTVSIDASIQAADRFRRCPETAIIRPENDSK